MGIFLYLKKQSKYCHHSAYNPWQLNTLQGPNSTDDNYHTAHSWVVVRLKDVNDNPPRLDKAEARVSLREDVRPGTLVETFTARDPDQGGDGRVVFSMIKGSDPRRHFKVSPEGRVTVLRPLDRETTPMHKVRRAVGKK